MPEMNLDEKVVAVLKNCKDAKEVVALAKSKGAELPEEKVKELMDFLQDEKIPDEDLDKMVGGGFLDVLKKIGEAIIKNNGIQKILNQDILNQCN